MRTLSIFLLSSSIVLFGAGNLAAQKGQGSSHAPSVNQGHGQSGSQVHSKTSSSHDAHTPDSNHSKPSWETKFDARLQSDTAFQTRIKNLLPAGMDPATAASGFKNRGQFIAALHVSQNLGIPFDQLKAKMTGISTVTAADGTTQTVKSEPLSLGKSIQELRPTLTTTEVNVEVHKAETQASTTEKTKSN
jgi:hypothetical protein